MDEAVGEVEVEVAEDGEREHPAQRRDEVAPRREELIVRHVRRFSRGEHVHEGELPDRPLQHAEEAVPDVVEEPRLARPLVLAVELARPPAERVERHVPVAVPRHAYREVDQRPLEQEGAVPGGRGLHVVGEDDVNGERDGEPHEVGRVDERQPQPQHANRHVAVRRPCIPPAALARARRGARVPRRLLEVDPGRALVERVGRAEARQPAAEARHRPLPSRNQPLLKSSIWAVRWSSNARTLKRCSGQATPARNHKAAQLVASSGRLDSTGVSKVGREGA